MSFETYGLPEGEYYKILSSKSQFIFNCLEVMTTEAFNKDINLHRFSDKFVWDLFMECVYSTDEEARMIQKENNPDEIKVRSWDPGPSRDELMDEIKSLSNLVKIFIEQNQNGFLNQDRNSNFPNENTID